MNKLISQPVSADNQLSVLHQNDAGAFHLWATTAGGGSKHTLDSYLRESHRFYVWLHENGLTANTLKVDHINHYVDLLRDPPPNWVRPRKAQRNESLLSTQLCTGPLSDGSIRHTLNILKSLFDWLVKARYVPANPFALAPKLRVTTGDQSYRFLDVECWEYLQNWLDHGNNAMPPQSLRLIRARWLINLLYFTGLRRSEVAEGNMRDFVKRQNHWQLKVIGKGNKIRYITIGSVLLYELQIYREALHLNNRYPESSEDMPLVISLTSMRKAKPKRLTPRAISLAVDEVFNQAALDCDDDNIVEQLKAASTHSMRHTYGTHRTYAGASLQTTQAELGHADIKTTIIYAKTSDKQRINDVEKLEQLSELKK